MMRTEEQKWRAASRWRRWFAFNSVGLLGIAVQLAALSFLTLALGWDYLLSTFLAVEAAILHNFVWHERWTWADQTGGGGDGWIRRLARFHLANGGISLAGNLLLMWIFVGIFSLNQLGANMAAITLCSLLNFWASDRWVFRRKRGQSAFSDRTPLSGNRIWKIRMSPFSLGVKNRFSLLSRQVYIVVLTLGMVQGMRLEAAQLRPETVGAWTRYAQSTERRIDRELGSEKGFLALDFQPPNASTSERNAVLAGDIPVTKMKSAEPNGGTINVPSGMIHHWRGSVFIPGVDIRYVLSRIANPSREDTRQEDVLDSRILDRGSDSLTLFLKLRRVKFVTVVYNTEHAVHYGWRGQARAFSRSVATRIAEVENSNTSSEREKPIGQDRGFLWRLNSYWRYEQAPGGVIVECESISLSRTVPGFLESLIRPLIDSAARESMTRTLSSMRERMIRGVRQQRELLAANGGF